VIKASHDDLPKLVYQEVTLFLHKEDHDEEVHCPMKEQEDEEGADQKMTFN
jgi:hypothetical protein